MLGLGLIAAVTVPLVLLARGLTVVIGVAESFARRGCDPVYLAARRGFRVGSTLVATFVLLFLGALLWGLANRGHVADAFGGAERRAIAPVLYDARDQFIGIFSARSAAAPVSQGFADYATVWSGRPALDLWSCLRHLEDRRYDSRLETFGIDPIGVLRSMVRQVTGGGGGGATLDNQVGRSMRGEPPSPKEAPVEKLRRKLGEWADAPGMRLLIHTQPEPAAFVTANLPLLAGASGSHAGDLPYGADAAALILFHRHADELDPVEQFMLAAADWRPILLAPSSDLAALVRADERWQRLKERAARCLPLLGQAGSPAFEAAKQRLMSLPPPRPTDAVLGDPKDSAHGFAIAVNPERRAQLFLANGGAAILNHDLAVAAGTSWRGRVTTAVMSFDAVRNRVFDERIERVVTEIQQRRSSQLRLALTGPDGAPDRAQILVVLTDLDGRVLRFFQSGPGDAVDEPRPVASLGKALIAAPLLGRFDRPDTRYCNRRVNGLQNAGGDAGAETCDAPRAWIGARTVFGKSMTLPLINRLDRIDPDEIRSTARALGYSLPISVPPQTAVPLGLFEATPRAILRGFMAIGRTLSGRTGDVPTPHLLAAAGILQTDTHVAIRNWSEPDSLSGSDIARYLAPSNYLLQVLSAPLGPGGTLWPLQAYRAKANRHLIFHAAKTGTSTTSSGATRDAMIAGTFETSDHRSFAYLVLAGTAYPDHPLGTMDGGALAPLARLAIEEALSLDIGD